MGVLRPNIIEWLAEHPDRRCAAHSKQHHRRCRQIAVRGKRVCYYHGGRSAGPLVTHWDCRLGGVQHKVLRGRSWWRRRGGGETTDQGSVVGAQEFTAADLEALLAVRGQMP